MVSRSAGRQITEAANTRTPPNTNYEVTMARHTQLFNDLLSLNQLPCDSEREDLVW